jgi:hypothetical protein
VSLLPLGARLVTLYLPATVLRSIGAAAGATGAGAGAIAVVPVSTGAEFSDFTHAEKRMAIETSANLRIRPPEREFPRGFYCKRLAARRFSGGSDHEEHEEHEELQL